MTKETTKDSLGANAITAGKPDVHNHSHIQNRFAVIPTAIRLAADRQMTGKGVTIAFLDSGFYPHPDLVEPTNRILAFADISQPEASLNTVGPPDNWDWHGTQTSVVAAGNGFLSDGTYRGLACDAQVVLVKVGAEGRISEQNIARGLEWVIENKDRYQIRVVNISLGGDEEAPHEQNLIDQRAEKAVSRGLVIVAASGNAGCTEQYRPIPPANAPSVITVGGYDDKNQLGNREFDLYCSSFGPTVDGLIKPEIIAPAIWVAAPILPKTDAYQQAEALSQLAAAPDYQMRSLVHQLWQKAGLRESIDKQDAAVIRDIVESILQQKKIVATHYQHVDGTSFAAPIVSAVVAQMIEANPGLSPTAVKHILISTADRISGAPAMRQGYGVLNARRAVELAKGEQHTSDVCYLCPPRMEAGKLVFTYHDDEAKSVSLTGDFNDWNPEVSLFTRDAHGVWRAEIEPSPPGRYRYKFLVDGARWVDDPGNSLKEDDHYGGLNSLLNLA